MKINLLLNPANRSWIIQKIAENLARELEIQGVRTSITDVVDETADLVHHMSWAFANLKTCQPSTMFVTHLDDIFKLNQVRSTLASDVQVGVCMSSDTMRQLQAHGCSASSLYYISPAHDGQIKPRRIAIGITSRVYADGRKREALLQDVAALMDLSAFEFRIFGLGWEHTIKRLESAGALVRYFGETNDYRRDYEILQAEIPRFDYYLYLGMDEGSLGTLDALSAGVPTIITPQGFHLDLPGGITHPVVTAEDLCRIFVNISAGREERIAAVQTLTWSVYAERHRTLWGAVLNGAPLPELWKHEVTGGAGRSKLSVLRRKNMFTNALNPRRVVSAMSHWPLLKPVRRIVDRIRSGR
jgi:hypothetical protein